MRILPVFAVILSLAASPACKKVEPGPAGETSSAKPDPTPTKKAGEAQPADAAAEAKPSIPNPFLWAVKKDGEVQGYLLGTIHLGVDAEKSFPAFVWARLSEADIACTEADTSDPRLVSAMQRKPGSKSLEQELGPDYWKKFETIVGPLIAKGVASMEPAGAGSLLMIQGLPMTPPMDKVVEQKAKAAGTKLVFLEEGMFQMQLLLKHLDIDAIKYMLDNFDEMKNQTRDMLAAYKAGDATRMSEILADESSWQAGSAEKNRKLMEEMLIDRNADWIPKLEKLFDEGTPFCAVGAAHLLGEKSVNELLAAKGYVLERQTQ